MIASFLSYYFPSSCLVAISFLLGDSTKRRLGMGTAPRRLRRCKKDIPHLLLFVHPRCKETLATVRQLRYGLFRCQREVSLRMIVICPKGTSETWYETFLIREARQIDSLEIVLDYGGSLTRRYGAMKSGTLLIYGNDRRLAFQGGITPMAGHEGDCQGIRAMEKILAGQHPEHRLTPVHGCQLLNEV